MRSKRSEAASRSFSTILLDGQDAFASDGRTSDLACRIYVTEQGLAGLPTQDQLEAAIRVHLAAAGET